MRNTNQIHLSVGIIDQISYLLNLIYQSEGNNLSMSAFCEIINRAKLENREDRDLLGYLQEMNLIAVVVNDDFNEDTVYIPHYIESILNKSSMHVNRELLWLDIRKTEPIWIKDMQYGIESLMNSTIDSNSKQIFRENGLFSTASESATSLSSSRLYFTTASSFFIVYPNTSSVF